MRRLCRPESLYESTFGMQVATNFFGTHSDVNVAPKDITSTLMPLSLLKVYRYNLSPLGDRKSKLLAAILSSTMCPVIETGIFPVQHKMAAASAAIRMAKNEIRQKMKNALRAMSDEERRWQSDILASMVCYQVHSKPK